MILITGSDGYIGAHMAQRLYALRMPFIGIDKVLTKNLFFPDCSFQLDLLDRKKLITFFKSHDIKYVFHFAGYKSIKESIAFPVQYFQENISSTINLLEVILDECRNCNLIFSSSASVYGNRKSPVRESDPLDPQNPYAMSKVMCEQMIMASGINYSILRYFNPVEELYRIRDHSPDSINFNLRQGNFTIFGGDYDTVDGTPVRDFIPINELIDAHLEAMNWGKEIVNVGTGKPTTVKQLADRLNVPYTIGKRREGDVAELWADTSKYKSLIYKEHGKSIIKRTC